MRNLFGTTSKDYFERNPLAWLGFPVSRKRVLARQAIETKR